MTSDPMTIDPTLSLQAVHERLGTEAATDQEAQLMRDILIASYPGREFESLTEAEWLTAYGEMNRQKPSGWMTEGVAMNVEGTETQP